MITTKFTTSAKQVSYKIVGVGLIFFILAVQRSTLPYNSEGNYFDGVVNYHEQSISVYGILAFASFCASMLLLTIHHLFKRLQQTASKQAPHFR